MKHKLLLCLFLACMQATAQVADTCRQVVRLTYEQVQLPSLDISHGDGCVWNFCNAKKLREQPFERVVSSDSTFIDIFDGGIRKYVKEGMTLRLVRQEHPVLWKSYTVPIRIPGNLLVGLSDSCEFKSSGLYSGRYAMEESGHYTQTTHAEGMLLLSEEDTLKHVLLTSSATLSDILVYNDTTASSFPLRLKGTEEHYQWKVPNFPYPILLSFHQEIRDGDKIVEQTDKVYRLKLTPEVKDELAQIVQPQRGTAKNANAYVESYKISCDEGNVLEVSVEVNRPVSASLLVSTFNGMVVHRKSMGCLPRQANEVRVDCSSLPRGQYAASISVGGDVISQKFIVK